MTDKLKTLVKTLNETEIPTSEQISELIELFTPGDETASKTLVREATEVISCIFDIDTIQKLDGRLVDHTVAALLQFSKAVNDYENIGIYEVTLDQSTLLIQVIEVTLTNGTLVHFVNILESQLPQKNTN